MNEQLVLPLNLVFDDEGHCSRCKHFEPNYMVVDVCPNCANGELVGDSVINIRKGWTQFSDLVIAHISSPEFLRTYEDWDNPYWTDDEVSSLVVDIQKTNDPVMIAAMAMFLWSKTGVGDQPTTTAPPMAML